MQSLREEAARSKQQVLDAARDNLVAEAEEAVLEDHSKAVEQRSAGLFEEKKKEMEKCLDYLRGRVLSGVAGALRLLLDERMDAPAVFYYRREAWGGALAYASNRSDNGYGATPEFQLKAPVSRTALEVAGVEFMFDLLDMDEAWRRLTLRRDRALDFCVACVDKLSTKKKVVEAELEAAKQEAEGAMEGLADPLSLITMTAELDELESHRDAANKCVETLRTIGRAHYPPSRVRRAKHFATAVEKHGGSLSVERKVEENEVTKEKTVSFPAILMADELVLADTAGSNNDSDNGNGNGNGNDDDDDKLVIGADGDPVAMESGDVAERLLELCANPFFCERETDDARAYVNLVAGVRKLAEAAERAAEKAMEDEDEDVATKARAALRAAQKAKKSKKRRGAKRGFVQRVSGAAPDVLCLARVLLGLTTGEVATNFAGRFQMHEPSLELARECHAAVGSSIEGDGDGEGKGEGEGGESSALTPEATAACFLHPSRPARKTMRVFGSSGAALRAARRVAAELLAAEPAVIRRAREFLWEGGDKGYSHRGIPRPDDPTHREKPALPRARLRTVPTELGARVVDGDGSHPAFGLHFLSGHYGRPKREAASGVIAEYKADIHASNAPIAMADFVTRVLPLEAESGAAGAFDGGDGRGGAAVAAAVAAAEKEMRYAAGNRAEERGSGAAARVGVSAALGATAHAQARAASAGDAALLSSLHNLTLAEESARSDAAAAALKNTEEPGTAGRMRGKPLFSFYSKSFDYTVEMGRGEATPEYMASRLVRNTRYAHMGRNGVQKYDYQTFVHGGFGQGAERVEKTLTPLDQECWKLLMQLGFGVEQAFAMLNVDSTRAGTAMDVEGTLTIDTIGHDGKEQASQFHLTQSREDRRDVAWKQALLCAANSSGHDGLLTKGAAGNRKRYLATVEAESSGYLVSRMDVDAEELTVQLASKMLTAEGSRELSNWDIGLGAYTTILYYAILY